MFLIYNLDARVEEGPQARYNRPSLAPRQECNLTDLRLRLTNVLLALVLLALLTVIGMLATDARSGPLDPPGTPAETDGVRLPGTPIGEQTVISEPGHYYLTKDIQVVGASTALLILASDVSLDLGGFTVRGEDLEGSWGIRFTTFATKPADVRIYNGTIRNFQFGIDTSGGERILIDNVYVTSNARGFHLGDKTILSGCAALSNTETGIYLPGDNSTVRDCVSSFNDSDGIAVAGNSNQVERNQTWNNGNEDMRDAGPGIVNQFRANSAERIVLRVGGMAYVVNNQCISPILNPSGNFLSGNIFC